MIQSIPRLITKSNISLGEGRKAYRELREIVTKKGILDRSYGYYLLLSFFVAVGFSFSTYQLITQTASHIIVLWSLAFSFFAVQVAGFIHDAAHRAIFKSPLHNDIVGSIASIPLAIGYTFWKVKHNRHHAHPNEEDEDPDVQLPLLSFTEARYRAKKGVVKLFRKHQAFFYFPIGILVFASVRIESFKFYIRNFRSSLILEMLLFLTGVFLWFVGPFVFFPFSKALIITIVVNGVTGLYLLTIFAPNHKGMPHLAKGTNISFLEQQVMTTRNIYGHWLTDFVYLGLNYQMEHHLFPDCPRNRLHLIVPYLKKVCRQLDLEYTVVNPFDQNRIILSELHRIARTA